MPDAQVIVQHDGVYLVLVAGARNAAISLRDHHEIRGHAVSNMDLGKFGLFCMIMGAASLDTLH